MSANEPTTEPQQPNSDGHAPQWLLLTIVCVGQFMVVLDLSIVVVALPAMQRDLHFSTSTLQWVVNAYALAFAGFLLLGGRAGDLFGRRRMFLIGLMVFSGASLVCALAQNQSMLIAARTLQGLGGAVLSPATLTILTTEFTEPKARSRALGIWSAMAAAGGASGALLGGVLTDLLSWRWIFLINVPIGIVTIIGARIVLRESKRRSGSTTLDLPGTFTITAGLTAFVYAIVGTSTHPWASVWTIVPLVVAVGLIAAFVFIETKVASAPLVPFRIFRSRSLSVANISMLFLGAAMFPMWLFLSLYLQDILGYSPLRTGIGFLPQTLAIVVGAQIASRAVPRVGPKPPLVIGTLLSGAGLLWLSQIAPGQSYWTVAFGSSTLSTLGMGLAFTPLAFAATAGVRPQEAGLASGILNTSRQMGGSLGLAILVTLATSRTNAILASGFHTGLQQLAARTSGFERGLIIGGFFALTSSAVGLALPSLKRLTAPVEEVPETRSPARAPEPQLAAGDLSNLTLEPD